MARKRQSGWVVLLVFLVPIVACGGTQQSGMGAEPAAIEADNSFVLAFETCVPMVEESMALAESGRSGITNMADVCAWPDSAEPVFMRLRDCWLALPQPEDPDLRAARSGFVGSSGDYLKALDLTRRWCTREADPAAISELTRRAADQFDSAMSHLEAYNRSLK